MDRLADHRQPLSSHQGGGGDDGGRDPCSRRLTTLETTPLPARQWASVGKSCMRGWSNNGRLPAGGGNSRDCDVPGGRTLTCSGCISLSLAAYTVNNYVEPGARALRVLVMARPLPTARRLKDRRIINRQCVIEMMQVRNHTTRN
jgi:hypothetical protein